MKQLGRSGLYILFSMIVAACSLPLIGEQDATPTLSPDEAVTFNIPIFNKILAAGESIPATQMTYLGREGPAYKVTIDGQEALKRVGDSFQWRGIIAPGVASRYNLRISPTLIGEEMLAIGSVELHVFNPVPFEKADPGSAYSDGLHFGSVKIDNRVSLGGQVPGTPFVYEGMTADGAQFSGVDGYPYRVLGDSLFWGGSLRDNVDVSYEMRVASINEEQVRLIGLAQIWIGPAQ